MKRKATPLHWIILCFASLCITDSTSAQNTNPWPLGFQPPVASPFPGIPPLNGTPKTNTPTHSGARYDRSTPYNLELPGNTGSNASSFYPGIVPGVTATPQQLQAMQFVNDGISLEQNAERQYMAAMDKREKQLYIDAYKQLLDMNPDQFSLTDAVYAVENAFMSGLIPRNEFDEMLEQKATLVAQILKREGLSTKNNAAVNYGIQQLYSKQNLFYNKQQQESHLVKPFSYQFEDFKGEEDYRNVFVTKLMFTGKGQCHSMPLLYLMLAKKLGAKAYASFSPQHMYIRFPSNGRLYNFETTCGQLVSDRWIAQSGYVTAKAIQKRTYCDTLSSRLLHNQMLSDLLLGYIHKFGIDVLAENLRERLLINNPNDLTANILDANRKTEIAIEAIKAAGKPKPADLPNYPQAYQAHQAMIAAYKKIDATGYQDIPDEAYQHWLKSIENEKVKQKNREEKQRLQREAHELNKSSFTPLKPH